MAEQDVRAPHRPLTSRSPWTVAWVGVALAVPVAVALLSSHSRDVDVWLVLAMFLGLVAAESINLQFEFRRQTFSSSASEVAFVIALVEVGGAWTAVARAAAVATVLYAQQFPRPKLLYNVAVAIIEVGVAVAIL